tara:strand:+ start:914 stop:1174 length:261 start_codon:yes stop_codon:yes gene_type:complete
MRIITIFRRVFSKPSHQMPLGRWCHPYYSDNCNIDIKSHLANLDNSYFADLQQEKKNDCNNIINLEEEKKKRHDCNLIMFADPNMN